jgi:16S rRNA processing protein RimM
MTQNTDKQASQTGWVEVAVVTGAHGIKGEVRIKLFLDDVKSLKSFDHYWRDQGETPIKFKVTKTVKNGFAIMIDGVTDRNEAETLRGMKIWVGRDALEPAGEDEFFFVDLVGLQVFDAPDENGDKKLGKVSAMHDYGAGGVVEIALDEVQKGIGKTAMVPFDRDVVTKVDIAGGKMTVLLADWLAGEVVVTPENRDNEEDDEVDED